MAQGTDQGIKALLMHPDRDFDLPPEPSRYYQRDVKTELPWHDRELIKDLELETLLGAMVRDDSFLFRVARSALLSGVHNDLDTILYRQEIVKDSLRNPSVVRDLYNIAVETVEAQKTRYFGIFTRYPGGVLRSAVDLLDLLMGMLRKLRSIVDLHAGQFQSRGFARLFATLRNEFSDNYFATVDSHLTKLKFKGGVLVSADLGKGNEGIHYVLREPNGKRSNWFKRVLGKSSPAFTFYLHPRDEAGARFLSELRDRGINLVANAAAQATEHILSFFDMIRTELAFYVCCLNLHERITALGAPACLPHPEVHGARRLHFNGLYDVCLALRMGHAVVPNSIDAEGKNLILITGANQGGKSSFLRSVGLAQLMMQSGMFVGAEAFTGELCAGLSTHYKREEDPTMTKGKLDEELSRMSDIANEITPNAMLLFNESFAATNEREGSEIARQVVSALLEKKVKVLFVTHLYDFAEGFFKTNRADTLFLRAERRADGTRTFRVIPAEPLETSYGDDVYKKIFGS
jgi:DNA mismatch repair ATPase MutS